MSPLIVFLVVTIRPCKKDGISLDNTLLLLTHRLNKKSQRPAITVQKNYDDLPKVECYAGAINQVFFNILTNAIDALRQTSSRQNQHHNRDAG